MRFEDVIGQQELKERLLRSAREGRVSHALLFTGPEGTGKLALAIALARYLNCSSPLPHDACGVCNSCHKVNKLIHPDLHFVFPVINTKKGSSAVSDMFLQEWRASLLENPYITLNQWVDSIGDENKQAQIYAAEASEILRKLNLKSFEAPNKVMIIWLPEKMNLTAANKLLKFIEEPPPRTYFFMITENPEQVLLTIRSRSQLVKVPRVRDEDLISWFETHTSLPPMEIQKVVTLANGDASRARSLMTDSALLEEHHARFTDFLRKSFSAKMPEIVDAAEKLGEMGRERIKQMLVYGQALLRQSFVLNVGAGEVAYFAEFERDFVTRFSKMIHPGNAGRMIEELQKAHFHISRNGYPRLILLDLSLQLMRVFHEKK
jgi:DNA polymerase-3 subunit delta'